jgi:hypothetical protein
MSKFQSKCDEGFLLGYSSNSKAYRVYNKSKGSQDEKENLDDVRVRTMCGSRTGGWSLPCVMSD